MEGLSSNELDEPKHTKKLKSTKRSNSKSRPRAEAVIPPIGGGGLSLTQAVTSMSLESISPPSTPLKLSRLDMDKLDTLKRSGSSSNHTASREQIIYTPHDNGLLNHNKLAFDNITLCFRCNSSGTIDSLYQSIEKTGYKLSDAGNVPVYRNVFMCIDCREAVKHIKREEPDYTVKLTPNAQVYFTNTK